MTNNPERERLKQRFLEQLVAGKSYARITDARAEAAELLGVAIGSGSPTTKLVDEAMEAAVVRAAPLLINSSETTHQAYDRLVELLNRQPNLGVRSSTSVLQQAYSTPIPIAYLAATLAGITPETTVYEPAAGNGALLLTANPDKVTANEINDDRFAELATRNYFLLTQNDATTYRPQTQVDRVICNPPFGSIADGEQTKRFLLGDTWTTQTDHVIALNALEVMKDDGRAVLILGGKLGNDEERRSERYNTRESRAFYYILYNHYNVTQHFSIWGDLYRKQGAGFPIDLIVIAGRGQSQRPLPAAQVPQIYRSFLELKEQLPNELIQYSSSRAKEYDDAIRKLPADLDASGDAVAVRGASSRDAAQLGRADLQNPDAAAGELDDRALDNVLQQPAEHPGIVDNQTERTRLLPGLPAAQLGRAGNGSADAVAASLGRNPDSPQRGVLSSSVAAGRQLSSDGDGPEPPGVSGLPGAAPDDPSGRVDQRAERLRLKEGNHMEAANQPAPEVQPKQVTYQPKSQGNSTGTLIPYNMASAAQSALDRFTQQHGEIDAYLASRLGYASIAELHRHFSAEQVDASALAISNIERGSGFIVGDQTGVGKGRICASILRYARQQGRAAVFVTQNKTLYADMMRDISDIGLYGFQPFITDTKAIIPLANGQELRTGNQAQQEQLMKEMMLTRRLDSSYSAVFTTYSQLQTVGQQEPLRRQFLRAIAPNAILILDEAHEAGGSPSGWRMAGPPDRAEFVRELVDAAAGVFYSSATYAKRPDVMDLYARRTDLQFAVSSMTALENILDRGGVPLQQIVASKFVASGQMLRRERSYEGISFQAKVVPVDRDVADQFSAALRAIKDFDRAKQKAIKELSKQLKAEAKAFGMDGAVGEVGAKSTLFTSLMHNCIEQGLLAQKAEATVQEALQSLQTGQKPVIAVANTMGSFIQAFAEANDIQNGNSIEISFSNLLERYLERSRDVMIKDYRGQVTRQRLTDAELGETGIIAYEEALDCIREADFSTIPVSPIDYITQRLERAGYSVREVTGRSAALDYAPDGSTFYRMRPDTERTSQARISAVAQFNSGEADVIILNCSGSTGISLHASERFADQRPRHMIVAQAERDINVFMQMLGRVHRTGQVALPSYTLLMSDLPAEKRPGAILCQKMAGLNANTTAARETGISIQNVVDFMNPYGEQVVTELLSDDLELDAKLDYPSAKAENDASEIALIKKVTGRIPLLPIAEQEAVYSLIESEYGELVEQQRAMGESILEADQLDLDARTVARMQVIPNDSQIQSEFAGAVYLEIVDVKSSAKPLTQLQVVNALREQLDLAPVKHPDEHNRDAVAIIAQDQVHATILSLKAAVNQYRAEVTAHNHDEALSAKFNEKLDKQQTQVVKTIRAFPVGTSVRVVTPLNANVFYGVVISLDQKARSGNPVAPNAWRMRILVADAAKQITLPLSKVNTGREGTAIVDAQARDWFNNDIYSLFDRRQEAGRTTRQIFTGNLIKAFEKYPKGKLVNYSDSQGQIRQGLIMPKGFDIEESLEQEPVAFSTPDQVKAFLTNLTYRKGAVRTLDELLLLKSQPGGDNFVLQTPKARDSGGRYYLDEQLIAAVGSDFYSVNDRMEVVVPAERLEQSLNVIMLQRGYALAAFEHKDIARDYLGIKLPELEKFETGAVKHQQNEILAAGEPIQSVEVDSVGNTSQPPITLMIASSKEQVGSLEKRIVKFLEEAELREVVTEDFHLSIENDPYIPLVVERHNHQLYLTHYLEQNGDTFIDTEMVFRIQPGGQLQFKETAVQDPLRGGEHRAADRAFAQLFSRNILEQGFAAAARSQQSEEVSEASAETQLLLNREALCSFIRSYLEMKDKHPDAVVLIRAGDFYETYLQDAQAIADRLELVSTSIGSGDPTVGRVPAAGFPVHALERYLAQLTQEFTVVTVADDYAITLHPQQTSAQIDASSAEVQELSLFDVNSFTNAATDYKVDTTGYDPSWAALAKSQTSSPSPVFQPTAPAIPTNPVPQPNLKELADQVRAFDLESVAASLGLEQDRHDRYKWRNGNQIISISNGKFMDWLADRGGGGAIDLVMHVQAVEFTAAVEWLSGQSFPAQPISHQRQIQSESDKPHLLEMPAPNERRWPAVRDYLVEARKLPAALVDRLHQRHLIYADAMQNAVFVRHATSSNCAIWQRGAVTGASLRGTWGENNSFHGLAAGSAREQGWFWFGAGQGEVKRVMLTESPIDALSLATLDKRRQATAGVSVYLSADGAGAIPTAALKQVLEQGGQVGVAFDADPSGEIMAWRVAQELPGVGRITPAWGKDWNERLIWGEQPPQQPAWDKQTLDELWRWHQVAQQLGKASNYLNRITEIAKEAVKGAPLSEQAKLAMQQDIRSFAKQDGQTRAAPTNAGVLRKKPERAMEIDG
ncbi:MAG: strawberry notch C-terminal domain-containing protein [Pegethrix bostrychoides GSE-TBD4-15B]|jgi:predicted RNA methylase|uniref:Strawberry notch C-terminal domain-containing protein n=1 Tax=Pegethrix bostrychoides GSE-TBD4-15B TaxID=2839662 RepID=A0A951U513_9CYAN|nr:strawberry notch C-terminal domain-containing protein [Pegethrix bostrychoides GSE-TBD4-15B]